MKPRTERSDSSEWQMDPDALRRRLAERLRQQGARHPEVAAAALAARGLHGLTVEEWALMTGIEGWRIDDIERGDVDAEHAPDQLWNRR